MKICFVHEEYPDETNFGGIATYQKIMAEYYANHGDDVYVVSRGKCDEEYIENNVHVIRVSSDNDANNINSVKQYRKKISNVLKKLQKEKKIEIIETPDWGANTIYFEKYRKIPIVVRLHTPLKIWIDYNNNDFGISKELILKWENMMLKNATLITSCSDLLKDMVYKYYRITKDIIVIPNPSNTKDFNVISKNENKNIIYVGSLEERKGVIVLAKSLNKIMSIIDDNYIYVVGKDTTRNNKNISTKEYMLKIIDKKFHKRIKFIGQVNNKEVNIYLNKSYLAIFPSTFDNYPYTILEAMASGKHIICSDNIGSSNLVSSNNYVFKTNDYNDLANRVLKFFDEKREYINHNNVHTVKKNCNQGYVCNKMKEIYLDTIKQYEKEKIEQSEIIIALSKVIKFNKIKKIKKFTSNLANTVYSVFTDNGKYVVKKYNYNHDFDNCNKLYNIYEENNIKVIRPINDKIIVINNNKYNIFNYIKHSSGKIKKEYIINLINIDRKTKEKANILIKCNKYYDYLTNLSTYNKNTIEDELFVINEYLKLKDKKIFNEQYLNHGDLSLTNIIFNNNYPYVIDFDETIITTKLYDFAVILVKLKIINNRLNNKEILSMIKEMMPDSNYSIDDYINVIKFYLCKILLEKFYLFENNKIDLFSELQISDNYKKYIKLLKKINNL